MATTAPAQTQLGGQQYGQSAWHHVSEIVGNMGEQTAGANGAIAMKGGRRRQRKSRKVDRRQSRRQRQSKKQRGGRR